MWIRNGLPIAFGAEFTHGGMRYTDGWWRSSTPEQKAALGVVEHPDDPMPDPRYYTSQADGAHPGKWISVMKSASEIAALKFAELAAYRWEVETAGILFNGLAINTERDSQAMITGAYNTVVRNPNLMIKWKCTGGFVEVDATTITALADAVAAHVQACFSVEAEKYAEIQALAAANNRQGLIDYDVKTGDWPETSEPV